MRLPRISPRLIRTGLLPSRKTELELCTLPPNMLAVALSRLMLFRLSMKFLLVNPTVGVTSLPCGPALHPSSVSLTLDMALGMLMVKRLWASSLGMMPLLPLRHTPVAVVNGVPLWKLRKAPCLLVSRTATKLLLFRPFVVGQIIVSVQVIVMVVLMVPLLPPSRLILMRAVKRRVAIITLPLVVIGVMEVVQVSR